MYCSNKKKWKSGMGIERVPTRIEKFSVLSKDPSTNSKELEKMRQNAAVRLRREILKLVESDDFLIMAQTRQAYRDAGDYAVTVLSEDPSIHRYELAMYLKEAEGTRRVSTDGFGEAYGTYLYDNGPDDEGNYEDL